MQRLEAQHTESMAREAGLLHKARPEWRDVKYAAASASAMLALGKRYGFTARRARRHPGPSTGAAAAGLRARAQARVMTAKAAARRVEPGTDKRPGAESAARGHRPIQAGAALRANRTFPRGSRGSFRGSIMALVTQAALKGALRGGLVPEDVMAKIWDISKIPLPMQDIFGEDSHSNEYAEWTKDALAARRTSTTRWSTAATRRPTTTSWARASATTRKSASRWSAHRRGRATARP